MKTAAIIAAAGKGERFGGRLPKQYLILGDKPLLAHTLLVFEEARVEGVILVVDEGKIQFCKDIVTKYHLEKVRGIVSGGRRRQESVYNGLMAMEGDTPQIVIVHDGIRPFITRSLIEKVVKEASSSGAAVAAVPVKETIKLVGQGYVKQTIERMNLWLAQTPQAFRYELLIEGFNRAQKDGFFGTDEAVLIERLGHSVKIVRGLEDNIKITTKDDLDLAKAILKLGNLTIDISPE